MRFAITSVQRLLWTLLLVCVAKGAFAQNPTITSFSPYHGVPGTNIFITGDNLQTASAVYFNGKLGVNLTVLSNSALTVDIPQGAITEIGRASCRERV